MAEYFFAAPVAVGDAVAAHVDDGHRYVVEQGLFLGHQCTDGLFGELAFGDVGDRTGKTQHLADRVARGQTAVAHPQVMPALVPHAVLDVEGFAAQEVFVDGVLKTRKIVRMHAFEQLVVGLRLLRLGQAEDFAQARRQEVAPGADVPVPGTVERTAHGVEQAGFALAQGVQRHPFARDVLDGAGSAHRRAGGIVFSARTQAEPAVGAVAHAQPDRVVAALDFPAEQAFAGPPDGTRVVRVGRRTPAELLVEGVFFAIAEQRRKARAMPCFARGEIPFPVRVVLRPHDAFEPVQACILLSAAPFEPGQHALQCQHDRLQRMAGRQRRCMQGTGAARAVECADQIRCGTLLLAALGFAGQAGGGQAETGECRDAERGDEQHGNVGTVVMADAQCADAQTIDRQRSFDLQRAPVGVAARCQFKQRNTVGIAQHGPRNAAAALGVFEYASHIGLRTGGQRRLDVAGETGVRGRRIALQGHGQPAEQEQHCAQPQRNRLPGPWRASGRGGRIRCGRVGGAL